MNAIQFGMSDLRSAYRIQRRLSGTVDFRVWEGDASIDGVVGLLRRLDIVIAMRFHAAIYALAHTRRVIGIDYRIGKKDKVGALLDDLGLGSAAAGSTNWPRNGCVRSSAGTRPRWAAMDSERPLHVGIDATTWADNGDSAGSPANC